VTIELLKLLVQAVCIERDSDGAIVGERTGDVATLYAPAQIGPFVDALQAEIANANATMNGGDPSEAMGATARATATTKGGRRERSRARAAGHGDADD
jgi:hypothetical protein